MRRRPPACARLRAEEGSALAIVIRPADPVDAEAMARIYNHYVEHTAITFDIEKVSADQRRDWMGHYAIDGRHRLIVAEADGEMVGWASSSAFGSRAAYAPSVESSIYLAPDRRGAGLGSTLYASLLEALEGEDVHRIYAGITLPNAASEALHRRFGFEKVGVYNEVGRKFDRYWDVVWFEKRMGAR